MGTVLAMEWTEHERGWGQRPDGTSLHETLSDFKECLARVVGQAPVGGGVPDEYSRPNKDTPDEVEVSDAIEALVKKKGTVWLESSEITVRSGARPGCAMTVEIKSKRLLAEAEEEFLILKVKDASAEPTKKPGI